LMVAVLADIAEVNDIQLLASRQFKAKSRDLKSLSAIGLINGAQKSFSYNFDSFNGEIGFAVIETTDDKVILDRIQEMLPELVICKKERGYACLFLAIVNIVELHSNLLLCGPTEQCLAEAAFGGALSHDGAIMDLGKRVSRKKDFIPKISATIKGGWTKPKDIQRGLSAIMELKDMGKMEVDPNDPYGRVERKGSVDLLNSPKSKRQKVEFAADIGTTN
jgi:manganese-dependent inorganic pyrophosphatase